MVQEGSRQSLADRGFEDHISCKKHQKYETYGRRVVEELFKFTQTTPTSATPSEVWQKGGLTMTDKSKTELTIVLACDTNDNAYDTKSVTGHYITSAGVKKSFTAAYNTTDTTTEVACCSDFYCWNLEDYTAATVLVSTVAVQAGDNVYIGTTGMVANAELRLATIAAAATYPVVTTLFGAGDVYGKEETNTAADLELVITLQYWTPWGQKKTGILTLNDTDSTTIVRLVDSAGLPVLDFYRVYTMQTTQAAGKYICIGYDADKRAGTVALDTFYGVIEEGNYESLHSRLIAPGSAYGKLFTGRVTVTTDNSAKLCKIHMYYTPKGSILQKHIAQAVWGQKIVWDFAEEVEPLSEIIFKLSDDAATSVNADVYLENIMLDYAL